MGESQRKFVEEEVEVIREEVSREKEILEAKITRKRAKLHANKGLRNQLFMRMCFFKWRTTNMVVKSIEQASEHNFGAESQRQLLRQDFR